MKTLKISVISIMMLTLLLLPAMQVKIPVAKACVPREPVEVQEITGLEKQQITNIVVGSSNFPIAIQWLKSKNIEIDTNLDAIQVFEVSSSKYSGYVVIILPKIDTISKDIKKEFGATFAILDDSKEILHMSALYSRSTVKTKSLIIESLTISNDKNYITYMLIARAQIYKIEKPYETGSSKIATPQNNPEIRVRITCEDVCWWACIIGCHVGIEVICHAACHHWLCIPACFALALIICHFILEEGYGVCSNGCDWICSVLGL